MCFCRREEPLRKFYQFIPGHADKCERCWESDTYGFIEEIVNVDNRQVQFLRKEVILISPRNGHGMKLSVPIDVEDTTWNVFSIPGCILTEIILPKDVVRLHTRSFIFTDCGHRLLINTVVGERPPCSLFRQ